VFEIGSSLRQARERQKLRLSQVEGATQIRARYLQAFEDERFDILPGAAYAKGFLRTYADYLGLDAQQFVDEYNTRFAPTEEPRAAAPVRIRRPRRLLGPRLLIVPVALAVGMVAWGLSRGGGHHRIQSAASADAGQYRDASSGSAQHNQAEERADRTRGRARSVLALVRASSETGRSLYERTLEQGQSVRFSGTRLWVRLGAPWNLDAMLNGKRVQLPGSIANVVVTPTRLVSAR
jgi:cytoskeletal protein RodZ